MKARILHSICLAALTVTGATAQSAVDAYNITPVELRGSARFVGMGGAFTSLGGDISCLSQNPAGIAMYRSSDLGLSFDISHRSYKSASNYGSFKDSETRATFDNIGYVGVANLSGTMRSFQWGISYSRLASFDRMASGYIYPTASSLSNYVASYTQGVNSADLLDRAPNDPYFDSGVDWLSALAYNSYMISNDNSDTSYAGLYSNSLGTNADAEFITRQRGHTDEYNIDFAGNVADIVYWGVGVGIVDMQYSSQSLYSEELGNALVYDTRNDNLTAGNAAFALNNSRYISGSGANLKLGVIVRPVDMLRIGAAIHTPTWMHLSHSGYGEVSYSYSPNDYQGDRALNSGSADTPDYSYTSRLNTPWRFMVGASTVIGSKAIISLDYERVAYNDMKLKEENYSHFGSQYVDNTYANQDVKDYFKAADIIRVGVEYRLLPSLSIRAGYNWQGSALSQKAKNPDTVIYTSSTDPSYTFNNDTQNICVGLGYRYKAWYIDATYQHVRQTATYHAYTPFEGCRNTPQASMTNNFNNVVISTGIRF